MEECASWPSDVNGDVGQYVDAMGIQNSNPIDFNAKWSWVKPEPDPYTRTAAADSTTGFEDATNVEDAPSSSDLIGRAWIQDIP